MTELDYKQNVVYVDFFDFLVKKEIIKRKLGFLSFFAVYDYIYNVNNELIETTKLRELLKRDDPDFPKSLLFNRDCLNIDLNVPIGISLCPIGTMTTIVSNFLD